MYDGTFGAMPDWYMALVGADRLGCSFTQWIGLPEWGPENPMPECVKNWVFARSIADQHAAEGKEAIKRRQDKQPS